MSARRRPAGRRLGFTCSDAGSLVTLRNEVFDHLGPQRPWWAWNTDNLFNHPMMGSVPMASVVTFAMLGPAALAYLAYRLVGGPAARGRRFTLWTVAWRTLLAGVSVPVLFQQWRRTRHDGGTAYPSTYVPFYGAG